MNRDSAKTTALPLNARIDLQQVLSHAGVLAFLKDIEGRYLMVSPRFAKLLSLPVDQVLGQRDDAFFPAEQAARYRADDLRVLGDQSTIVVEEEACYAWGSSFNLVIKFPVLDPSGKVVAVGGFITDIAEYRQTQAREQAHQRMLSAIARIQSDFLIHHSERTTFEEVLELQLELTASEFGFVGEVLHDDNGAPFLKTHAISNIAWNAQTRALYESRVPNLEFRNNNTLFGAVLNTGRPVISNDPATDPRSGGLPEGHPPLKAFLGLPIGNGEQMIGMIGVANRLGGYDETLVNYLEPLLSTCAGVLTTMRAQQAQREAEAALRESEQRYRELVELSPDAVWVYQDNQVVFANRAAAQLLAASSAQQLHGLSPFSLMDAATARTTGTRAERFLAQGWVAPPMEIRLRALDGSTRLVESAGSRVMYAGRPAVQTILRDISERKRTQERENQSRRMESLGTLAGGVAHDFNNLLAAMRTNVTLALEELADTKAVKQCLEQTLMASERAITLVRQIQSFSRSGGEARVPMDLGRQVGEILGILRPTLPAMLTLTYKAEESLPMANAVASQVHQIVMNLVGNAVHAIGSRPGRIDVTLALCPNEGQSSRANIRLRVTDDGCGINEHARDRIFDPFYTTKAPGEGIGLGLAIVHEAMRAHEGRIEVHSKPGEGTTFNLYFPATEVSLREPVVNIRPTQTPGARIMLIDDDPLVNYAMCRALNKTGYAVTAYTDPAKALTEFLERPEAYDVLVVDLAMPGMTGLEFAEEALRGVPHAIIVLTSGYIESRDEALAKELGITQLLSKPYPIHELAEAIQRAQEQRDLHKYGISQ